MHHTPSLLHQEFGNPIKGTASRIQLITLPRPVPLQENEIHGHTLAPPMDRGSTIHFSHLKKIYSFLTFSEYSCNKHVGFFGLILGFLLDQSII